MIEGSPAVEGAERPSAAPLWVRLQEAVQEAVFRLVQRLMPSRREADPLLWNIRLIHRALWVVLAGLGVYTAVDLAVIRPKPRLTRPQVLSVQRPANAGPAAGPAAPPTAGSSTGGVAADALKPSTSYIAAVTNRNPFTGGGAGQITQQSKRAALEELVAGLTVVGIDRSASPVALIEDGTQQRTYVVRVGDELNGMSVKRIDSTGVLLKYGDEEILLQ